jgi:hypothetical protein
MKKTFTGLFIKKETLILVGDKFKKLYLIALILLVAFLMIGFALGSKNYLAVKMNNPLVKYQGFDLPLSEDLNTKLNQIIRQLTDSLSDRYLINSIKKHEAEGFDFATKNQEKAKWMKGVTLQSNDSIISFLIKNAKSKIRINNFDESYGLIIRKSALSRLGYDGNNDAIYYLNIYSYLFGDDEVKKYGNLLNGKGEFKISVPVLLVVDDLPFGRDFVCSSKTLYVLNNFKKAFIAGNSIGNGYLFLPDTCAGKLDLPAKKTESNLFHEKDFVKGNFYQLISDSVTFLEQLKIKYNSKFEYSLTFSKSQINGILASKISNTESYEEARHDAKFLSIQFSSLDSLRRLKEYMETIQNRMDIKGDKQLFNVDVSSLESKENFNFVSKLTAVLSISLILFGAISLLTFLINSIQNYFEKIKKNLGTIKAFGLSNKVVIRNYLLIYSGIIFVVSFFAFGIASVLGELGLCKLIIKLMGINAEANQNYFDLFNSIGFGSLFVFIGLSMVIAYYNLVRTLSKTPGDLIFER